MTSRSWLLLVLPLAACSSGEDVYVVSTAAQAECVAPEGSVCERTFGIEDEARRREVASAVQAVSSFVRVVNETTEDVEASCTAIASSFQRLPVLVDDRKERMRAVCGEAAAALEQWRAQGFAFRLASRRSEPCEDFGADPCDGSANVRLCEVSTFAIVVPPGATAADAARAAEIEALLAPVIDPFHGDGLLNAGSIVTARIASLAGIPAPCVRTVTSAIASAVSDVELVAELSSRLGRLVDP